MSYNSVTDILAYVLGNERNDDLFYRSLSAATDNPVLSDLFTYLADEETEHIRKIELEIQKLGKVVPTVEFVESKDVSYLIEDGIQPKEILELAIEKEKDAFRLYCEMGAIASNEDVKDCLFELAEEEVRHKMKLEKQYNAIMEMES